MSIKRFGALLILSIFSLTPIVHSEDKGSPNRSTFSRALKAIFDSITIDVATTVLGEVSDIPTQVACMSYSNFNNAKSLADQMIALRQEGVIDLNIYKKYYKLMLDRVTAQIGVSGGQAINSEANKVKTEVESVELTEQELKTLATKYQAIADEYDNAASVLNGLGSVGNEPSHGELIDAVNTAIESLRSIKVPDAGAGILAAIITELGALKKRVEGKPEMNKWEREEIAKMFPGMFDAGAKKLKDIGAVYSDTSKALKGLAKAIAEDKPEGEIQAGLDKIIADLEGKASAGAAEASSAAGSIGDIDAKLAEMDIILKRVDKFRELEEMVIDIHSPICDEIKTYKDLQDPKYLFVKIGQDFSAFAAETTPFKNEFANNSSKVSKQILASSKQAAKNYSKEKIPPIEPDDCGNMYIEPLEAPPGSENLPIDMMPPIAGAFQFPNINPPSFKKPPSCIGSKCSKKTNTKQKQDRYTKILKRAAKKFTKDKKAMINKAFSELYGRNMTFEEGGKKKKKPSLYPCE